MRTHLIVESIHFLYGETMKSMRYSEDVSSSLNSALNSVFDLRKIVPCLYLNQAFSYGDFSI